MVAPPSSEGVIQLTTTWELDELDATDPGGGGGVGTGTDSPT